MIWNYKELWGLKMKIMLSLIFVIFISGCSNLTTTKSADLYDSYLKQVEFEKNNTMISNRVKFFTKKYLSNIDPLDEKSLFLLNLTGYVDHEISHHQKINGENGCLSVNAVEKNNDPIVVYLEYKNNGGSWLVNNMFIHFIESSESYTKEALCPQEAEQIILDKMA